MKNVSVEQARVIAAFNRGRIDSKKAARLIKKAAARKGAKSRRAWK